MSDPKGVGYPDRVAFKTYDSPVYAQLRDSLGTNTEPQDAFNAYQHGGDLGPFVPPRPRFIPPPPGNPPNPPDDDDDLMGPPGPGPERYTTLLEPSPRPSDQILMNEGMQPPPAPPPPPAAPSMAQQAGNSFAQAAGNAAGGVVGTAAATAAQAGIGALMTRAAAAAGMGAMEGAEAGPAGVLAGSAIGLASSLIGDAIGGAVRRGFQPGGGSSQQPAGPPTIYGPGGLRERAQARPQEGINRQQRLHNQGTGEPAAQVDIRTLNGQNDRKPRDRKVRFNNEAAEDRIGVLGGASGSSSGPLQIVGGTSRPGAPLDPGGTKIPRDAEPAPAGPPSYKDLVGKIKKAPEVKPFKPFANPVTPSRPRERSPPRGDRRPLDAQRRTKKDSAALFPGGDGREEALSRRSKTIPKAAPNQYYIGDQGEKRKAETDIYSRAKPAQPVGRPLPKQGTKRKAVAPPSDVEQDRRKPPPKPRGRLEPKDRKIGKPRSRK